MKKKDQHLKDEKWNKYDIDQTLAKFNVEEPFYGHISANINKYKTKDLDTAGVSVQNGKMCLFYNEEFFQSLNWRERQGLLIHEFLHLILNHATSRMKKDKNGNPDKAWFFACFPEGTILADGKPIEEFKEFTIGRTGLTKVNAIIPKEYNGKMIKIQCGGMEYVSTPEHKFRICRKKNKRRPIKLNEPEWISAEDIKDDDYLIIPKLPGEKYEILDLEEFINLEEKSNGRNAIKNKELLLDEDLAWLLGLYTGDGSGKQTVSICLGAHEIKIIEKTIEIAKKLKYKTSFGCSQKTVSDIKFGGPTLAKAFKKWCGSGAKNKKIPDFILLNENKNIVKSYLQGLIDSDGYIAKKNKNPTYGVDTSSKLLASHIRLLLSKLDIGFHGRTWYQKDRYINNKFYKGGTPMYRTNWSWEPSFSERNFCGKVIQSYSHSWKNTSEGIAIPIKSISSEEWSGTVYDINTDDSSFIVNGALVHNCDFAVNSLIDESRLPPGGLIPGKWKEVLPEHRHLYSADTLDAMEKFRNMVCSWSKGESADWYYEQINENRDIFDKLNKENVLALSDDHGKWEELSSEEKEIVENNVNRITEEAAETCNNSNHWGSVSSKVREIINEILKGKIDWIDLLKYFVGNSLTSHQHSTIKKINRRYPYIHPGKKRIRTANIAVCVDQSGSIDNKDLAKFFSELNGLADHTEFIVIPFDSQVIEDQIFTWEKGQQLMPERVARGGTDFDVPTNWTNENSDKYDAVIFMTDGFCSKPIDSKIPRCWVISPKGRLLFETDELKIQMQNS